MSLTLPGTFRKATHFMKKTLLCLLIPTAFIALRLPAAEPATVASRPPVAKKVPHVVTLHGDTRVDDYYWMREKSNPEVIAYLEAENAYTREVIKPTENFQETLYKEMLGRIKQSDLTVPYRLGAYTYSTRTEKGKQYSIYCREPVGGGSVQVYLDLNELARGQKFLSLGAHEISHVD
jgi:oligopeptidase B